MNRKMHSGFSKRLLYRLITQARLLDVKTKSNSFTSSEAGDAIQRIYIISLDRKPDRWRQVSRELKRIRSRSGASLLSISRRFSAIDARYFDGKIDNSMLRPFFSLADQLRVEPNRLVKNDAYAKALRIEMTPQEIAVALSHIEVWKSVAASNVPYTLILEDDVYFQYGFARDMDVAWRSIIDHGSEGSAFDILFLSFQEVGISSKTKKSQAGLVRKPDCGIWQASGYVLSLKGAQALLKMLPVYGPVDLWLNLQFEGLDVFLTRRPIIEQRVDVPSTNSYSIMPVLSQIGVYTHEKPLIATKHKLLGPIFAFGSPSSGLTGLAMALSILGYTCCSDVTELPEQEQYDLVTRRHGRRFNAYVNVGSLRNWSIRDIVKLYPDARFIFTTLDVGRATMARQENVLFLSKEHQDKWAVLSRFLKCEYPASSYPTCDDIDRQVTIKRGDSNNRLTTYKQLRFDTSPWIISSNGWRGITIAKADGNVKSRTKIVAAWSGRNSLDDPQWKLRDDTFPDNLSIFTPDNVEIDSQDVTQLTLREQTTAVRLFTSAAIVTQQKLLFGKFVATLKPTNARGLVTGMFLYRNSPRQEIDIEFLGKDTTKMLVNVFYNPGLEGTKLEYGYRGTPVLIDLGFDASKEFHQYEIEWHENILRWHVDGHVVYERVQWDPTPIPNLPMEFNVNIWYSRSKGLAGEIDQTKLPTHSKIKSIQIMNRY
ncbi:family 16 glycosylhydrolase [Candidatus Cryosericum septentrionale]|jgi:GR25 family glycosyltransferase involved in LPS biosynthesis|nr:family 16 glycosylhydrolase [Candidatus Cryosericum septentrionale]